ncbi:TonB-dependent receptor [Sinomicrobium weinanense]|uniref:TonB-dependent receptor n=1 Tax=Sinomicrobium weinanense TaxID=2842200 RepID=A0A926JSC8_9FLAO|nr:TonB-dependent receptor [Sinomicrobium weinanense]MBC9796424.1 TonB-dependent receptor [Sinomicrobium weinanense]MBU3125902.1 TonB-dependent receptor [Sinomicrobium weinanense]
MKLLLLLFIVSISMYGKMSFGQNNKFSMDYENVTIGRLMDEIEVKTPFKFIYNSNTVNLNRVISINIKDRKIEEVLKVIFDKSHVSYEIYDGKILLKPSAKNKRSDTSPAQQQIEIKGHVNDAKGTPLPGVNVIEKGTRNGTQTDFDGNFKLDVTSEKSVLVFSYIGMQTIERPVDADSDLEVVMKENNVNLQEVVVVGYGKAKKADLTSSISTVSPDDLEDLPVTGVEQALQGRASGVTVTSSSGLPGSSVSVRIRGIGTVNNNNPLYVVDGVPTDGMNYLNPSDIESIQVLKDASAAAIYGSRAANGVILITTKKGKQGKPSFSLDAYYGISKPWRSYDPADREEYLYMVGAVNGTNSPIYTTAQAEYDRGYNTNWWDETIRTASIQQYNFSVNGGTDKVKYNFSIGHLNQEGSIDPSGYKRLTGRINTSFELTKSIEVGENLSISNEVRPNTYSGILRIMEQYDPLVPVIDPEHDQNDPYNKWGNSGITFGSSPRAMLARTIGESKSLRLFGNVYANLSFTDDLVFSSSLGFDVRRDDMHSFSPIYYFDASDHNDLASAYAGSTSSDGWTWSNTVTWTREFGPHHIKALAGMQAEERKSRWVNGTKFGQPGNDDRFQYIDAGTEGDRINGSAANFSLASYFGRVNYNFKDKYLLTGSIRWDGSSNFAKEYRWGMFPSVSGGWVLSREAFWKDLGISWLSSLKLRGGWGQLGNQQIPGGSYVSFVEGGIYRRFVLGNDNIVQGYSISNTGNSTIQWETSEQSNVGIEAGFFNGALTAEFEVYNRKTKDMLIAYPVARTFGASSPWVNAGSVENKGFEITAKYNGIIGDDFKFQVGGNLSHYKNEVTGLGQGQPYVESIPGSRVTGASRTTVGHPIGEFYGWKTDGIFQDQQEIDNYTHNGNLIQPNARPGDFRFVDTDHDGTITDKDKTTIGNPHPDFTYGANIDLEYKSFDLSVFLQGSYGNDLFNINKYTINRPLGFDNVEAGAVYDAWTPENGSNTNPVMSISDPNNNYRASDWYVENGSYMRVKNVQLGYNFPESLLSSLHISSLRIYIAAQNLFTFTRYSGLDPELGAYAVGDSGQQQRLMGVDFFTFPQSRTFQAGCSIKF